LGIKDIYIGPRAPQFVNEEIYNFLAQQFNLKVISGDFRKDFKEALLA
jgi:hydroxylamine reductase